MAEFKSILCPIDFSGTSIDALRYAAALAKSAESRLTVLHVEPVIATGVLPAVGLGESATLPPGPTRDDVLTLMRLAVDDAGVTAIEPVLLADVGPAHETIVHQAAALPADLIVLGTHGRSGFNRLLLGSVTEKVVRTAPCPVFTVPPGALPTPPAAVAFKRILCPIDFSPSASKALHHALALGRQAGGSVTVLTAIEYLDKAEPPEHVDADIRDYRNQLVEHARERLHTQLSAELRTWCDIDEVVAIGRAYREILDRAAAMNADLIVMGAQGHGGLELMLYGSNTQHVVRRATCPVLTVRA